MSRAHLAANQPEPASAEAASVLAAQEETGDFFRDFRAQRETARADEIALLDEIVHREGAPEESVREADARRIELTRQTEQERAIETQLVAKGFEDAAAFVQEGTVTIVVKRDRLSDEDTAQILEDRHAPDRAGGRERQDHPRRRIGGARLPGKLRAPRAKTWKKPEGFDA